MTTRFNRCEQSCSDKINAEHVFLNSRKVYYIDTHKILRFQSETKTNISLSEKKKHLFHSDITLLTLSQSTISLNIQQ